MMFLEVICLFVLAVLSLVGLAVLVLSFREDLLRFRKGGGA